MNSINSDIFKKISSEEEKLKILNDLIQSGLPIVCKGSSENLFQLVPERIGMSKKIVCQIKKDSIPPNSDHENLIIQFMIGTEKYFAYTGLNRIGHNYELDLNADFFHVQRRQSYRIRIPESYRSKLELINTDTGKVFSDGIVFDFSSGGLRIQIKHDKQVLKEGERFDCRLTLKDRNPITTKGLVKHIRTEKKPMPHQIVGIQFTPITQITENKIFAIIIELHRELYLKNAD